MYENLFCGLSEEIYEILHQPKFSTIRYSNNNNDSAKERTEVNFNSQWNYRSIKLAAPIIHRIISIVVPCIYNVHVYRITGNFRGMLIFVVDQAVMKFSTYEN